MNRKLMESFSNEYRRYKILGNDAINQTNQEQFLKTFGDASIAMYVNHLGGNFKSRFKDFLISDGEKPDRHRDREFELNGLSKDHTLTIWNEGWEVLENTLSTLNDSDLEKKVTIRKQELSVSSALTRSLSHTSYHIGQIVLLSKIQLGNDWKCLSIPRGESSSYNLNPYLEVRK